MNFIKILIISFSLAADAFAVALCKGINTKEYSINKSIKVGMYFGFFQSFMPLFGFCLGQTVRNIFYVVGHYVVFFFLVVIGAGMLYDAFCSEEHNMIDDYSFVTLFVSAIATSIDAFSVGITFVFMKVNLLLAIATIGIIAFILSGIGVYIGNRFGKDNSRKAKMVGGVILIVMAIELLLEHIL